jgi:hypothetical protein
MTAIINALYVIASGTQTIFNNDVHAGDSLLAFGWNSGGVSPMSTGVTVDSDTCTKVSGFSLTSMGYELWVAPNMAAAAAGTVVVNVNNLGTGVVVWYLLHCSGLNTTTPLDIVATGVGSASTMSSSSFSPNYSNELSIIIVGNAGNITPLGGYSVGYAGDIALLEKNPIPIGSQVGSCSTDSIGGSLVVYTFSALDSVGSSAVLPTDAMFFGLE